MRPRFAVQVCSLVMTTCFVLTGCSSAGQPVIHTERSASGLQQNAEMQTMMLKMKLMQEMAASPDLPAWHDQREKMAMAIGDRVIDKSFDRAFDSMIIALGNLGCRVNNMERESGYITASAPQLPPEQLEALHRQATAQYAEARGYPPSVLSNQGMRSPLAANLN